MLLRSLGLVLRIATRKIILSCCELLKANAKQAVLAKRIVVKLVRAQKCKTGQGLLQLRARLFSKSSSQNTGFRSQLLKPAIKPNQGMDPSKIALLAVYFGGQSLRRVLNRTLSIPFNAVRRHACLEDFRSYYADWWRWKVANLKGKFEGERLNLKERLTLAELRIQDADWEACDINRERLTRWMSIDSKREFNRSIISNPPYLEEESPDPTLKSRLTKHPIEVSLKDRFREADLKQIKASLTKSHRSRDYEMTQVEEKQTSSSRQQLWKSAFREYEKEAAVDRHGLTFKLKQLGTTEGAQSATKVKAVRAGAYIIPVSTRRETEAKVSKALKDSSVAVKVSQQLTVSRDELPSHLLAFSYGQTSSNSLQKIKKLQQESSQRSFKQSSVSIPKHMISPVMAQAT